MSEAVGRRHCLVVAGEASADALAAATLDALGPRWCATGAGGVRCGAAGMEVIVDADDLALIGLVEVISGVPRVLGCALRLLNLARKQRFDCVLLVDLPDFNLHLGPLLRRVLGPRVPIVYLGAPQAWAWRPGRARAMARWVDALCCLYPFERAFFRDAGVRAHTVGHPRAVAADRALDTHGDEPRDAFVVCPGSRRAELARHGPLLAAALPALKQLCPDRPILVPVASTLSESALREALGTAADLVHFVPDALAAMARSRLGWVCSGTAVTECVLMGTVPVVFYRLHPLTWAVARQVVRVPHIAMANLLAGERLVPELVQDAATVGGLIRATRPLLDHEHRAAIATRLGECRRELVGDHPAGPAAAVAEIIEGCVERVGDVASPRHVASA